MTVNSGRQPSFSDSIEFKGRRMNKRIERPEFVDEASRVPKTNLS